MLILMNESSVNARELDIKEKVESTQDCTVKLERGTYLTTDFIVSTSNQAIYIMNNTPKRSCSEGAS